MERLVPFRAEVVNCWAAGDGVLCYRRMSLARGRLKILNLLLELFISYS